MKLVLATSNLHKILELKSILRTIIKGVDIYSLRDFSNYKAPKETGETFAENAELKAAHAAKELNMVAIADDSGLVIPALSGEPGVKSRRYAGEEATDKENREKLIDKLSHMPVEHRSGYFECALCFASPEKIIKTVLGKCEGTLLIEPRGGSGFGYDPLFIKYDYNKTMAELDEDTKNRISHRRKALEKLLVTLEAEISLTI